MNMLRNILTSALEVVGLGTVAVGFGLAWVPLGIIAAGAALVLVGWLNA